MPFCNQCYNILSINKSDKQIEFKELSEKKFIDIYKERIYNAKNKYPLSEIAYHIKWPKEKIKNIVKNLTEEELNQFKTDRENLKERLEKLHDRLSLKNNSLVNYIYFCNDCNIRYFLEPGTVTSCIDFKINETKIDELPSIRKHDNTLMRTKDYKCINVDCESNTKKNNKEVLKKKEACLYKLRDNQIIYVCTLCNTKWGT